MFKISYTSKNKFVLSIAKYMDLLLRQLLLRVLRGFPTIVISCGHFTAWNVFWGAA
jgi:hypothetical protein